MGWPTPGSPGSHRAGDTGQHRPTAHNGVCARGRRSGEDTLMRWATALDRMKKNLQTTAPITGRHRVGRKPSRVARQHPPPPGQGQDHARHQNRGGHTGQQVRQAQDPRLQPSQQQTHRDRCTRMPDEHPPPGAMPRMLGQVDSSRPRRDRTTSMDMPLAGRNPSGGTGSGQPVHQRLTHDQRHDSRPVLHPGRPPPPTHPPGRPPATGDQAGNHHGHQFNNNHQRTRARNHARPSGVRRQPQNQRRPDHRQDTHPERGRQPGTETHRHTIPSPSVQQARPTTSPATNEPRAQMCRHYPSPRRPHRRLQRVMNSHLSPTDRFTSGAGRSWLGHTG